jgi:hypothetical protein
MLKTSLETHQLPPLPEKMSRVGIAFLTHKVQEDNLLVGVALTALCNPR